MKRIVLLFVAFLVAFVLSGCNNQNTTITMMSYEIAEYEVNNYFDASMLIVTDSITNKGLSLELNYYGKDEGITGPWYTILLYEDNQWNELPYVVDGDVGWNLPAYPVEKNHSYEMAIDWEWLYGELSAGRYLIVKQFTNHRDSGDNDKYYLACEFTI
jgi:hypothetical protein